MAYPSKNTFTLKGALDEINGLANVIRAAAVALRDESAAGPVASSRLLVYLAALKSARTRLTAASSTSGLQAYAQAQYNNVGLDITAEYGSMSSAVDSVGTWIITNFPKSGGFIQAQAMDAQGVVTDRVFTTVELVGLRTQLDALIATIAP